MADMSAFRKSLRAKGKKEHVAENLCQRVTRFAAYLADRGRSLDEAGEADISDFAARAGRVSGNDLRALALYFHFQGRSELAAYASESREKIISRKRKVFKLEDFMGVDKQHMTTLAAEGIRDVNQMIQAGRTPAARRELAERTGIPLAAIVEYVKLSDLSRLGAIKTKRARLYVDAGLDTIDKIASMTPEGLCETVADFIERSGFDGIPTLPKEAENAVKKARAIKRLVVW